MCVGRPLDVPDTYKLRWTVRDLMLLGNKPPGKLPPGNIPPENYPLEKYPPEMYPRTLNPPEIYPVNPVIYFKGIKFSRMASKQNLEGI